MLLKMFIPTYYVRFLNGALVSAKADGLIGLSSIVKIEPMKEPLESDGYAIAARILYGNYDNLSEGYITTEWYEALIRAQR